MNTFLPVVDELSAGHPVKVYYEEAELIQNLIKELKATNLEEDFQKYFNIFNELSTIEKRFARKENQLFPYLEKHGWDGPSQGMWSFHDNLREIIRLINKQNEE
ncbi:MAG: hemerythrin domain-containing protein, partial [Flavobacteriales bacterium]|nr:hemerythrin domain-containing protein [Flavobacteriales bacterium]